MPSVSDPGSWRRQINRRAVISKIEASIQQTGVPIHLTAVEMENFVFTKVKTREQYMNTIAKLLFKLRRIVLHQNGHPDPDHVIARLRESNGQRQVNTQGLKSLQNLSMQ
ncbi:mediator of RNA polymerase II transcription subunit 15-like [Trichoplusia ni]|uniref:Mediator of RNA polymerase II transcription subunit 15 n=1 Tax=Trichoplusia ni TaxID=7111 RepID=A0A7E5WCC7_TRINI|nr:mediator of RNA polymerase II transcription subunit 15-like [Trichoplusia ni]